MFRNHLKTAIRLFARNKVYSIINLVGLSLALMMCFFAYLYIQDEYSYDQFHSNSERLYLINRVDYSQDNIDNTRAGMLTTKNIEGISKSPVLNLPFFDEVESSIPEIEKLVRIETNYSSVLKEGKSSFEYTQFVDEDFFDVMGFEFLYGDRKTALSELGYAVVSEDFAMKQFGEVNVVGQELLVAGEPNKTYIIKGVISSAHKSVINTNLLVRIENSYYFKNNQDNRSYNAVSAFVLLNEANQPDEAGKKIRQLDVDYRGPERMNAQRDMLKLNEDNPVVDYELKEISGIYLDPTIPYGRSSSPAYSLILAGIAFIILIIACINYLSICIASSAGRRSEIAIRKVVGARGLHLKGQFYAESLVLTLLAVLMGFTLTQGLMPLFNELAGKEFELSVMANAQLLLYGLAFGLLLTLLAGGLPAQILSRFKVISGLKGKGTHRIKPGLIRGMVVFQFTICLVFITTGLMMRKQFNYISNKDLGFDKEQVVYINGVWGKTHLFKEELAKYPSIVNSAGSTGVFVGSSSFGSTVINGVQHSVRSVRMDEDLFSTLGLELIDVDGIPGIDIADLPEDKALYNETYYNTLKEDTAMFRQTLPQIAGVVKDFHFESLQREIRDITFRKSTTGGLSTLFVKIAPNQTEDGLAAIRETYLKLTEEPLEEISFLDNYLNSRYKDSQRWQKMVNVAAAIGVLIACIGLFGLTGIGMVNQLKELSIRKVLGAGHKEITYTLNRQSFLLIAVSSVISIPISYYLMESWLGSFAYHVSITADLFAFAVVLLVVITLITVTYHSVKVILTNPANILRNE
ncbi:ABC transporter permease [Roseivirga sp.]|uniref:ABC transporter permease n=1 Tax=Roseivirga sp. TaxID=1964215 RepID=UPI003B52CB51